MTIDSNKLHSFIITSSSIYFYLCNYGEMDCHVFSIFDLEINQVSFSFKPDNEKLNNSWNKFWNNELKQERQSYPHKRVVNE